MALRNGLLLLLLFNGRLNGWIGDGFPRLTFRIDIGVVKMLTHLPPVWFTASALSPQMPLLQRWPGPSPRTLWTCLGHSSSAIYSWHSRVLQACAPALWPAPGLWSGGNRGTLAVPSRDYLLSSMHQTQQPSPLWPRPSLPQPFFPTTLALLMRLTAHRLSLGRRQGRGR